MDFPRFGGANLASAPPQQQQQQPPQQPPQPPQPPPQPPPIPDKEKSKPQDMNKSNPRLLVNRESVYERQLPGDAYITVYVQRLQHGYYSSSEVSDPEASHVDFLALSFVFHSPHTLSHRFKSATIRASVQGPDQLSKDDAPPRKDLTRNNPRILMHAPHLIYGTVSPETMEWTFSLAGSIGISETPISANLIPSGSVNGRYRRYEMMRIQGSARTLKDPRGRQYDIESGEVVWSLEENNLQRSGLPREFTFVMLIQKPQLNSPIKLTLEIDPVIQSWWGNYPMWALSLPTYRPRKRRDVDFNKEVGQRFEPLDPTRGFNFAALVSRFDDYIAMPGRKYSRRMEIPPETDLPDRQSQGGYRQGYPGQYGSLNPMQPMQNYQGMQNAQTQGMQGMQGMQRTQTMQLEQNYLQTTQQQPSLSTFSTSPSFTHERNNLNLSLPANHGVAIMNLSTIRSAMASPRTPQRQRQRQRDNQTQHNPEPDDTASSEKETEETEETDETSNSPPSTKPTEITVKAADNGPGEPHPSSGPGTEIETIRSSMLRSVHWTNPKDGRAEDKIKAERTDRVMIMDNRPLTHSLLALVREGEGEDEG